MRKWGLVGFEGGGACQKIWPQRGVMPKNMVCKGGSPKKIAFKFDSDSICNNANISARMPTNSISKVLKIQIFQGQHAPGPPYFSTPNGNSTPPTALLRNTAWVMPNLLGPLLVYQLND